MTEELRSLNELCALALGWTDIRKRYGQPYGYAPDGEEHILPDFSHSLDACEKYLWPVLLERGYYALRWDQITANEHEVKLMGGGTWEGIFFEPGVGPTPAAAFCEAYLAVVGDKS